MAKKNPFDTQHAKNVVVYQQLIDAIFAKYADEMTKLGAGVSYKASKVFAFADYPATTARVKLLLNRMSTDIERVVVNGVANEWALADRKNDELCDKVFGKLKDKLTPEQMAKYYKPHDDALEAFLQRKTAGLKLSDRVWKYTNQFKNEIELALDAGIRDGLDASSMTKSVKHYLQYPDKLFRRVREKRVDENGNEIPGGKLVLSKAARAFHPGRGVYRSSYKNALRLTSTETNIAYRSADYERWKSLDFVVGIHIEPSKTNHTQPDICDDLAGDYPKEFKFVGWHPFCRCHATSILKTEDELVADVNDGVDRGSVNAVKDVPKAFSDYIDTNSQRIAKARDLPYFLRDNGHRDADGHYTLKTFGKVDDRTPSAIAIAKARHDARTAEDIKAIRDAWEERKETISGGNEMLAKFAGIPDAGDLMSKLTRNLARANWPAAQTQIGTLRQMADKLNGLTYIDDAFDVARQFSYSSTIAVEDAVKKTLSGWSSLSLKEQATKLNFEIYDYFDANFNNCQSKYPTWKVARNAYAKRLKEVQFTIDADDLKAKFGTLFKYKTSSKVYKDLMAEGQYIYSQGVTPGNIAKFRSTIAKAENQKVKLDAAAAKRAAKKNAGSSTLQSGQTFGADALTQDRRDAALWAKSPKESDDVLRKKCGELWRAASNVERDAAYSYTDGSDYLNLPLRGASQGANFKAHCNALTDFIDRSHVDRDMWLQRGDSTGGIVGRFGVDLYDYRHDPSALIGKEGLEKGFLSCGDSKGAGLGGKVIVNVYAPKGTKMLYCAPFSKFGGGQGRSWDGIMKQSYFGREAEVLIQRGTRFRITKAEYTGGMWYLDVDVIGQEALTKF